MKIKTIMIILQTLANVTKESNILAWKCRSLVTDNKLKKNIGCSVYIHVFTLTKYSGFVRETNYELVH